MQQWLHNEGIGFNRNGFFLRFPIDDAQPVRHGRDFGLTPESLCKIQKTWSEWRKLASNTLKEDRLVKLCLELFRPGEHGVWKDRERSELEDFLAQPCQEWFFGPQITRIDLTLSSDGRLQVLDPNIMPYGVAPMVATSEKLNLSYHQEYLRRLQSFDGAWITDRHHGGASSIRWICALTGTRFVYSDQDDIDYPRIIRQTRWKIRGSEQTVSAPGMRVFESQIWPALSQLTGFINLIPERYAKSLLRTYCPPSYLIKVVGTKVLFAQAIDEDCRIEWISHRTFLNTLWPNEFGLVYLKCLASSGCHQVTYSRFKEGQITSAIHRKLFAGDGYALLQPAQPCLVGNDRIRVSVYLGHDGAFFGAEVTRVPSKYLLAHGGSHSAISYLEV